LKSTLFSLAGKVKTEVQIMQESQLLYLLMTLSIGQTAELPQHPPSPQITYNQSARRISPNPSATLPLHSRRHAQSAPHPQMTGMNSKVTRLPDRPHTAEAASRSVVFNEKR